MKKLTALIAAALSCLFLFAACSVHIDVSLSPNWQSSQTSMYDNNFYEQLTYSLSFSNSVEEGETGMRVLLDAENSSYTVTIEAVPSTTIDGTAYYNLYRLTTEYVVSAEYLYTDENGNTTSLVKFGGENGEPDRVVTETLFHSLDPNYEMQRLQPVRVTRTVLSHTPAAMGTVVSYFNYTVTTTYDAACDSATISFVDGWGELSDEERKVSDFVTKYSYSSELTVEELQKNYSVFDNSQLYFMARGLDFASTQTAHTVNVVGEAGARQMTLTCASIGTHRYQFYLDNMAVDADITAVEVTFALTGANSGSSQTVFFAQKAEGAANLYRNLPLLIQEPYDYNIGTMNLTLASAFHTRQA